MPYTSIMHVWSVSDLIRQINLDLFRYNDIAVEGEVTNFTRSSAGHCYFSIKDARAQMRVVLFASNARFLRFRIENGLNLVVRGRLAIYDAKGDFQLNATSAEPAGLGALQLAFDQLKQQLADEGLFEAARKKPIPMLPQRIAVVTSPEQYDDVLDELREQGISLDKAWFAPHFEFRFPVLGSTAQRGVAVELRTAIEPWHVLGEEPGGGGGEVTVDDSLAALHAPSTAL